MRTFNNKHVIRYEYDVRCNEPFSVCDQQGVISTKIRLDREVLDNYLLTASATDNGQTRLSGFTSVSLTI